MTDVLVAPTQAGVARVTLNRPERHNAWTVGMQASYFAALEQLTADPEVRAIVVTGTGGTFCPGADTEALSRYSETGTTNPAMALIEQPEWYPALVPKPMIAAIGGMCAGVGLAQALLCDLRIAAPDTRFTTAFAKRALPPMHGMVPLLTRVAGDAAAAELLLTARTFSGEEALRLGVVTSVSENPLAQATELAERIAATCAPTSLMTMKQALLEPWLPRIEEAVTRVDATLDAVLGSAEFREGLDSLLERRPPAFPGLRIDPTH